MLADETWILAGAAGRVASCLRPALAGSLAQLRLLDLEPVVETLPCEETAACDLRDLEALTRSFAGAHGVIHLGGLSDEADYRDLADVNITGTFHVLEASRRSGLRRIIFASTNHVTGLYPRGSAVSAEMPTRPDSLYGVSKVAGEALCRLYAEKFGLEVACIRIGTFAPAPPDERALSTWLSPADCTAAFMAAPQLSFSIFYGVSRNTRRWWDLRAGEALGFHPEDDAERYAHTIPSGSGDRSPDTPRGGGFASPQYTLERAP